MENRGERMHPLWRLAWATWTFFALVALDRLFS
jgi:hypothetical protein